MGDRATQFVYFAGKKAVFARLKEPGAGIYVSRETRDSERRSPVRST
jgi:hypothetical protein